MLAQTRSSSTVYYNACTNTFQYYRIHKTRGVAASPIKTRRCLRSESHEVLHVSAAKDTRFCSFSYRHRINDAKTTRTWKQRADQLAANKGPAPKPPDYKWEPFATHSGKKTHMDVFPIFQAPFGDFNGFPSSHQPSHHTMYSPGPSVRCALPAGCQRCLTWCPRSAWIEGVIWLCHGVLGIFCCIMGDTWGFRCIFMNWIWHQSWCDGMFTINVLD